MRPKSIVKALGVLGTVYGALSLAIYVAMLQPPATFTRIMSKLPGFTLVALPFQPLWTAARAGHLTPGDAPPPFDLYTSDRASRVSLASLRGKPVVLVFGSYT